MAGSYRHVTNDDGQLLDNESFLETIDNLGDAYEAVEEMYGMIWYLANQHASPPMTKLVVDTAAANYQQGLFRSPGVGRWAEEE